MSEQELRLEMIEVGRRLYAAGLAVAKSGNLSCRLDNENICDFPFQHGTYLGTI